MAGEQVPKMFVRTTAINKILAINARKKVIQGGTSAGKTFGIIPILIDKATKTPGLEISVVSETIPHLRRGALKDFVKIMQATGRYVDEHFNKSLLTYTFANGSFIEFFSAEQEDKLRGARRDVLYINEANNITFEAYHQLAIRTRGDIFLDYNPSEEFWAHTEVLTSPDSELLILTYKDNEALPPNVVSEFEMAKKKANQELALGINGYWRNWCRVYIDGEVGTLQGAVFNNWGQVDAIPEGAKLLSDGLDFGFTNDPTAYGAVYLHNNEIFIDELIYESGLTNPDISAKIKQTGRHETIVADSAEPKSIEELRRLGHRIIGTKKGKDSVRHSINLLQQKRINITKRSINTIREFRGFRWMQDRTGALINEPIGYNDHMIAAVRYVALMKLDKSQGFNYSVARA